MKFVIRHLSFVIQKVSPHYRPLLDVLIFCVITYGFHELWWWLAPWFKPTSLFQEIATFMTNHVFNSSSWILQHIFGWTFEIQNPNTFIFSIPASGIRHPASLEVNESCSGLKQFFQIAILFILFPGPWKHKLWYIPVAILIMHGVNILRIVVLSVILVYHPDWWTFSHDWILRPFFYVIIFLEWLIWLKYFRNKTIC